MNYKIIFTIPNKKSIERVSREFDSFRWIYLGKDATKAIYLEKRLNPRYKRIHISRDLNKIAKEIKSEFLKYIDKISSMQSSIFWWFFRIPERNLYISKMFLYICYIKLCQKIIDSYKIEENIVIFTENTSLLRDIKANLASDNYELHFYLPKFSNIFERLQIFKTMFIKKSFFFVNYSFRILMSKFLLPNFNKEEWACTIVFTWIRDKSIVKKGKLNDVYFGDMIEIIKKKDNIKILPYILNNANFLDIIQNIKMKKEEFIIPWHYFDVIDLIKIIKMTLTWKPQNFPTRFMDINIKNIIELELLEEKASNGMNYAIFYYLTIKKLKVHGFKIKNFIFPYENHVLDKAFILALREEYPRAKIIGYQHSSISQMELNYDPLQVEIKNKLIPDIIITNGQHFTKMLISKGFDRDSVITCGAFRYKKFLEKISKFRVQKKLKKIKNIVVVSPIGKNETLDLVWSIIGALGDSEFRVILQFHPLLPYKNIKNILGNLPKNFEVSSKPLHDILENADLVIYLFTTAILEAIARDVPVLKLFPENIIDWDPLEGYEECYWKASREGLIDKIKQIEYTISNKEKIIDNCRNLIEIFFELPSEKVIHEILEFPSGKLN